METSDSGNAPNFLIMEASEPLSIYSSIMLRKPSVSMQSIYLTMFSCFNFFKRLISYYKALCCSVRTVYSDTCLIATDVPSSMFNPL